VANGDQLTGGNGLIDRIERFVNAVNAKANWVACLALVAMMTFVFYDVVARRFGHPTPGSIDIVQILSIVLVALAMGHTQVLKRYPSIDLIFVRLPKKAQTYLAIITNIVSLTLFVLVSLRSFVLARNIWLEGQGTMTLAIPIAPLIYCIGLGSVLMSLVLFTDLIIFLRRLIN
jgi:TRAP-type C4-dicarboxylate transport system permease small subunit